MSDLILDITFAGHNDVGPAARKKLSGLIKFYMKKKQPFTACVNDNTKRFGVEGAKKVCATLKDIGEGDNTHWRKGGKKSTATIGSPGIKPKHRRLSRRPIRKRRWSLSTT